MYGEVQYLKFYIVFSDLDNSTQIIFFLIPVSLQLNDLKLHMVFQTLTD